MAFILMTVVVLIAMLCLACAELTTLLLRRAFRHWPIPQYTIPQSLDGVIDYARPAAIPTLLQKRPWIAATGAGAITIGPLLALLVVACFVARFYSLGLGLGLATLSTVAFILLVTMQYRSIRRSADGTPAAASWRLKRWRIALLALMMTYVVAAIVMDWAIRRRLERVIAESTSTLAEMTPRQTDQAFPDAVKIVSTWADAKRWGSRMPGTPLGRFSTEPPPVPPELELGVKLLKQAAEAPSLVRSVEQGAHPARLAFVLQWHAVVQAREGRWTAAMQDVGAIQALARAFPDRRSLWSAESLTEDAVALRTIEQCLPFVVSEKQLDEVPLQDEAWYEKALVDLLVVDRCTIGSTYATGYLVGGHRQLIQRNAFAMTHLRSIEEAYDVAMQRATLYKDTPHLPPLYDPTSRPYGGYMSVWIGDMNKCFYNAMCERNQMKFGMEVMRYRLRRGTLPDNWDDLVAAGLIQTVPIDPWDGKRLLLERKGDEVIIGRDRPTGYDGQLARWIPEQGGRATHILSRPEWE